MTLNIVDLFCGAGGMTAGILAAADHLKRRVNMVAVNHWDTAINSHSLNHPGVRHLCEPVENIVPCRVIPSRRLHLLAAGCECTYHSIARGGGPCNEQSRSQPWQLIRWATDIRVENILMENVKEFLDWGPLHPVTKIPVKKRKGEYFRSFVAALRALGYSVDWRIQCAADFGDPTSRRRFILMARLEDREITWPEQTHFPPEELEAARQRIGRTAKCWRTAREIIDWSLKGTSIFDRKKPLCGNTLQRIEAGLRKFGGPNAEPFLIILRGTQKSNLGSSHASVDEPLSTVSTSGKHHCLVEPKLNVAAPRKSAAKLSPFVIGQQSCAAPRSADQPLPTIAGKGAIQLVEPFITPNFTERKGQKPRTHSVHKPLPAVTGHGAGMLVEPFITHLTHHGKRPAHSLNKPLPTVTGAHRGEMALVEPFITQTDQTGGNGAYSQSLGKPLGTIVSKQNRLLVQPMIAKFYGTGVCQSTTEPLDTVTTRDRFMLVEFPVKTGRSKKARTGTVLGELDILTRMLQPHELAKAHSLDDFVFTGTKEDQTKQIGNSVPKQLARAHALKLIAPCKS